MSQNVPRWAFAPADTTCFARWPRGAWFRFKSGQRIYALSCKQEFEVAYPRRADLPPELKRSNQLRINLLFVRGSINGVGVIRDGSPRCRLDGRIDLSSWEKAGGVKVISISHRCRLLTPYDSQFSWGETSTADARCLALRLEFLGIGC